VAPLPEGFVAVAPVVHEVEGLLYIMYFSSPEELNSSTTLDPAVDTAAGEVDYDAEELDLEHAAGALRQHGIGGIIYSSPSHCADRPHWRVVCPFDYPRPPDFRAKMVDRLNGALGGILARESWTLSQSYYYGSVAGNADHRVIFVEGAPINLLDELDTIAIGRPLTKSASGNGKTGNGHAKPPAGNGVDHDAGREEEEPGAGRKGEEKTRGGVDEDALCEAIRTGADYHEATTALLGLWARRERAKAEAIAALKKLYQAVPEAERDHRWQDRYNDIGRTADGIYGADREKRKDADEELLTKLVPVGFTNDDKFVLIDTGRQIALHCSARQLGSSDIYAAAGVLDLCRKIAPAKGGDGFSPGKIRERLIRRCRAAGPFDPERLRGRGVWIERGKVIVNLGEPVPEGCDHTYLCFQSIALGNDNIPPDLAPRLLRLLNRWRWKNSDDALLFFGGLAIAPICGALRWRPHLYPAGPAGCGKSTVLRAVRAVLSPLVLSPEGGSTEAGIRQKLQSDSLPIVLDEFDLDQRNIEGVIRLARSASSAETPMLRGTPEGKAQEYSVRAMFIVAGVSRPGMVPADQTRWVMPDLLPHSNKSEDATKIGREIAWLEELEGAWCRMMISRAHLLAPAIAAILPFVEADEMRRRQNIASLLGGVYLALASKVPDEREAKLLAELVADATEEHGDNFERSEGEECLDKLYAHMVRRGKEEFPLGHWIAVALEGSGNTDHVSIAREVLQIYGIKAWKEAADEETMEMLPGCIVVMNGSPRIDAALKDTKWSSGGWLSVIRQLDGVKPYGKTEGRKKGKTVDFGHDPDATHRRAAERRKSRGTEIPLTYAPRKIRTFLDDCWRGAGTFEDD